MSGRTNRGTLLQVQLLEEKYGSSFMLSVLFHLTVVLLFLALPHILPKPAPILLGTGPGGGVGGATYTVGVADDLGGGEGMFKPSLIPQPPTLPSKTPDKEETQPQAIEIPRTVEQKPAPKSESKSSKKSEAAPLGNIIPTAPQPGAGGTGGVSGGSGGGRGGGVGVSLGAGSGGLGDFWYARAVESRISSNWIKPQVLGRIEIVYSFVITNEGHIREIRKDKSSGNEALDLTAERAIRASTPLPPLPPELRGRPVQFVAQFIYPPNP